MKTRLATLLVIAGGVIYGVTKNSFNAATSVIISLIGGFLLGFSFMLFTSVYSGKVWGIKISSSVSSKIKKLISVIGLVIGGYSLVYTILLVFVSLLKLDLMTCVINIIVFIVALIVGPFIAKIILEKDLAKGNTAAALGQLDIFKEIDSNLDQASDFVVGFEGVALFSKTNYCYAVYLYEDYQLGTLSTPDEVALVGTYFVQKYGKKFTFKVDVEVIPGTPGQTVVAVGTGGIGIARIQGTPDKRLFRSYIFKRRKA